MNPDKNYPNDALLLFSENEPTMKRSEVVLNYLPSELYRTDTNEGDSMETWT